MEQFELFSNGGEIPQNESAGTRQPNLPDAQSRMVAAGFPSWTPADTERFWGLIERGAVTECWPVRVSARWAAYAAAGRGVGQMRYGKFSIWTGKSRWIASHRVAWMLTNGPIPRGHVIRHKCDNPPCCNPTHLEHGTHEQNSQDMIARGRQRPDQKLSQADVDKIRLALSRGGDREHIALAFGVASTTIYKIATGRTWARSYNSPNNPLA